MENLGACFILFWVCLFVGWEVYENLTFAGLFKRKRK